MNADNAFTELQKDALVLYRNRPARITAFNGSKIVIETRDGISLSVRQTDIMLLHPGPICGLSEVEILATDAVEEACALLESEATDLHDLTELLFGTFTPSGAWTVYTLLADGIYFTGSIERIVPRPVADRQRELAVREVAAAEKCAWSEFIEGLRNGMVTDENRYRLVGLEDFALGKNSGSMILKALSIPATAENAHKLLLKLGMWNIMINPYPHRLRISLQRTYPKTEMVENIKRLDLTDIDAYAIDDDGNRDPDDAISIDGNKLWIHIADVASVLTPDCEADIYARELGSTLYLPEAISSMLAPDLTQELGLGLQKNSPALSFCITLGDSGDIIDISIHLTYLAVTRLTYSEAEKRLDEPFFRQLCTLTTSYRSGRISNNAVVLNFPETRTKVIDGTVVISPIPMTRSRELVAEAMMIAGEAAARFSHEHGIPFPYTVQLPPETIENPVTTAAMFAYRKKLKPSFIQSAIAPHAGLGIKRYSRVTSPLRRYIDLVAHQQLRAYLTQSHLMDEQTITNRIGAYNAVIGNNQKLERLSNLHWTLVYLLQHQDWKGRGIVVEKKERYQIVLIPDLALETRLTGMSNIALDEEIMVKAGAVDLADLSVHFSVI